MGFNSFPECLYVLSDLHVFVVCLEASSPNIFIYLYEQIYTEKLCTAEMV